MKGKALALIGWHNYLGVAYGRGYVYIGCSYLLHGTEVEIWKYVAT